MKSTLTLTVRMLIAGLFWVTGVSHINAWDKTPDANGKYDSVYDRPTYFPEWEQPSEWANAMYYLCEVQLWNGGPQLENYEVAVYDQDNQLRHCSRSIASDAHHCVLTIRGIEGDVFHFQIIYGDDFSHPEIVDVKDVTCDFKTNDIVGGDTPFVLAIGEVPNAISSPNAQQMNSKKQPVFDMQGRLVAQPSKGVYISQGKKIIVR